jgi:hypothetical protein
MWLIKPNTETSNLHEQLDSFFENLDRLGHIGAYYHACCLLSYAFPATCPSGGREHRMSSVAQPLTDQT